MRNIKSLFAVGLPLLLIGFTIMLFVNGLHEGDDYLSMAKVLPDRDANAEKEAAKAAAEEARKKALESGSQSDAANGEEQINLSHLDYVINLLKFVAWPKTAAESERMALCLIGSNPFGQDFFEVENRQKHNGPAVRTIAGITTNFAKYCHAVYIGDSEQGRVLEHLRDLKALPVLTISAIPGFVDAGGMVELVYLPEAPVSIRVNQQAAESQGLHISSKLLTLSK